MDGWFPGGANNCIIVYLQCLKKCFSQEQLEEIFSPPHLRKVRAEFDSKVQQYISEVSVPKGRYLMSLWEGAKTKN